MNIYLTMIHKWSKTRIPWSFLIWLDHYLPFSSKIQVLDSTPSRILGHYWAYYLTPNNGRILNIFRIARRGRVISRSLQSKSLTGNLPMKNSARWEICESRIMAVVYFDQLSGDELTWKLVEMSVFGCLHTFFFSFTSFWLKRRKRCKKIFVLVTLYYNCYYFTFM